MAGLFTRVKTWIFQEDVDAQDLNNEFDNIIANAQADKLGGHSGSTTEMRATQDPSGFTPGGSTPASIATEIEFLRYAIQAAVGGTYWFSSPAYSIASLASVVGLNGSIPLNRVSSGRVDANNQPMFLQPNGTGLTCKILATATNLIYRIANVQYSLLADVTSAALNPAPSTLNTATVGFTATGNTTNGSAVVQAMSSVDGIINGVAVSGTGIPGGTTVLSVSGNTITLSANATASNSGVTLTFSPAVTAGDTSIPMISAAGNITAAIGSIAAFQIGSEIFLGYVQDAFNITRCMRGIFFDSADANYAAASHGSASTITLLKLVWIFLDSGGAIQFTYTNPTFSKTQPASPSSGDFWYNFADGNWYVYSGGAFVASNATLVGFAVTNTTACIGGRSVDAFMSNSDALSVGLSILSSTELRSARDGFEICVYGNYYGGKAGTLKWLASNVEGGGSVGASTTYYAYIKDTGDTILSAVKPLDRSFDLRGWYHPAKPWRCVGFVITDGSSNFSVVNAIEVGKPVSMRSQSFRAAGSFTWTAPLGYDGDILIKGRGGSGGGGGGGSITSGNAGGGGGGGSGATSNLRKVRVEGGKTYAIVVGPGGAAGAGAGNGNTNDGAAGSVGGTSSFGGSLATFTGAPGGGGGAGQNRGYGGAGGSWNYGAPGGAGGFSANGAAGGNTPFATGGAGGLKSNETPANGGGGGGGAGDGPGADGGIPYGSVGGTGSNGGGGGGGAAGYGGAVGWVGGLSGGPGSDGEITVMWPQ